MELTTWTLLIVACVWLYFYLQRKLNYFKDLGIPYAPGWPLVGSMFEAFIRRKHFTDVVIDIYNVDRDAKYVGAFDFSRPVLVLRDPEIIKTVTIKNFDNFPDHNAFFDESVDPLMGGSLFNMVGERWKESRNLLTPAFTTSKMKMMFEPMVVCAENFVKYLAERPPDENKMIATKDLFTKYTNDVIATCAFGISVDSLKNPDNDFYVLGRSATNFEGIEKLIKLTITRASPRLAKLLKLRFVNKKTADFFTNVVSTTVAWRDEKGISRPDMLQLMMDARNKDRKHLKLTMTDMTAQAFVFFFGGFDSTSNQMCIVAHELAINPDIQRRLQDEIDEVVKKTDGKPTYEAINSMLYLDAVFNESIRLHTQASFIDRLCQKAFELPPAIPGAKPFTVPVGMNVWIPASAIHRDPKYYENPSKFDPDRYYHKKITINDVQNLGFGIGPRGCIGNRFAILETKVLFFHLLSKYTIKPNEKTTSPFVYSKKKIALTPEGGFSIAIEPRC